VVTGSLGSNQRLKYSVVGDVVVTAQRVQALDDTGHDFEAEPCRILIGEQTRDYVAESVLTREFGEVVLKGKAQPTMIYRVLGRAKPRAAVSSETGGKPR
jgi:adenylate cyclase